MNERTNRGPLLTLEQFRASRREVPDLGAAIRDNGGDDLSGWLDGQPGFLYDGDAWMTIYAEPAGERNVGLYVNGWDWVKPENQLPELEERLYQWAVHGRALDGEAAGNAPITTDKFRLGDITMANYGRFAVIQFPSFYVVTDMEQHTWVSEQSADKEKVRREAQRLQEMFKGVPPSEAARLSRLISLCVVTEQKDLREEVRRIIEAAAENATEHLQEADGEEDQADEWGTAFDMAVENECDDAIPPVQEWFKARS